MVNKDYLKRIVQVMLMLALTATAAFAQQGTGDIDMTNARTMLEFIVGLVLFAAAVFCLFKLVMAFLDFRGQDFGHGMQNLILAAIAAVIVGVGVLWINSLTGQNIAPTTF